MTTTTRAYPPSQLPVEVQCGDDLLRHLRERTFHMHGALRAEAPPLRGNSSGPGAGAAAKSRVRKMKATPSSQKRVAPLHPTRAGAYELLSDSKGTAPYDSGDASGGLTTSASHDTTSPHGSELMLPSAAHKGAVVVAGQQQVANASFGSTGAVVGVGQGVYGNVLGCATTSHYSHGSHHPMSVSSRTHCGMSTSAVSNAHTDRSNWLVALDSRPCSKKSTRRDHALASTFTSTLNSALAAHLVPQDPRQPALGAWPCGSRTSGGGRTTPKGVSAAGGGGQSGAGGAGTAGSHPGGSTPSLPQPRGSGVVNKVGIGGGGGSAGGVGTRPALLERLETYMRDELSVANSDETRLRVYQEVFQSFLESFESYRGLLSEVKEAYDDRVSLCSGLQERVTQLEATLSSLRDEEEFRIEEVERRVLQREANANAKVRDAAGRCEDMQLKYNEMKKERDDLEAALLKAQATEKKAVVEKKRYAAAIDKMCDINNALKADVHRAEKRTEHVNEVWRMKENSLLYALQKLGEYQHIKEYKAMKWNVQEDSPPASPRASARDSPRLYESEPKPPIESALEKTLSAKSLSLSRSQRSAAGVSFILTSNGMS